MNSNLNKLHSYPFERLNKLLEKDCISSNIENKTEVIDLSIGEPKHNLPKIVENAIHENIGSLSSYPSTKGDLVLRITIAEWLKKRHNISSLDPNTQVLPVLGSREAIFSFTQTVIEPYLQSRVLFSNPFYQIYEGATLLAGAIPYYVYSNPNQGFSCDWYNIPEDIWKTTKLLFICSPNNPTGNVISLDEWKILFELSDRYNFIIASDECYSEIYYEESNPPLGGLKAARIFGRDTYHNLVVFSSLSKRSNLPGLRSGFVAGDSKLIEKFLLYRTYHGSAMSPLVSIASIAAWKDENHVRDNRKLYREKFDAVIPILKSVLPIEKPNASFYLWIKTPIYGTIFSKKLYNRTGIIVLPGSFLSREIIHGKCPGLKRIRIALVQSLDKCIIAAKQIREFIQTCT